MTYIPSTPRTPKQRILHTTPTSTITSNSRCRDCLGGGISGYDLSTSEPIYCHCRKEVKGKLFDKEKRN